MKGVTATVLMVGLVICLVGCGSYVERSKYEDSQRELQQARAELNQIKSQLKDAHQKLAEASAQKFSTYQNGGRTWRFNSQTGETCILLTSEWDWKNKKTQSQSCDCQDTFQHYMEAASGKAQEFWDKRVQRACGW